MRLPRAAGFTLVEILVVLVIIAIATAVVAPALRPPGSQNAANDLLNAYRLARREAAARGRTVTVRLELASGAYVMLAQRSHEEAPDTVGAGTVRLESGTRLRASHSAEVVAVFSPLGTARGGRVLVSAATEDYEVIIDPWTGTAAKYRR